MYEIAVIKYTVTVDSKKSVMNIIFNKKQNIEYKNFCEYRCGPHSDIYSIYYIGPVRS